MNGWHYWSLYFLNIHLVPCAFLRLSFGKERNYRLDKNIVSGSSVYWKVNQLPRHRIPWLTTKARLLKHVRDQVDRIGQIYLYLRKSVGISFDSWRKDTVATAWENGFSHQQQIRSSSFSDRPLTIAFNFTTASSRFP